MARQLFNDTTTFIEDYYGQVQTNQDLLDLVNRALIQGQDQMYSDNNIGELRSDFEAGTIQPEHLEALTETHYHLAGWFLGNSYFDRSGSISDTLGNKSISESLNEDRQLPEAYFSKFATTEYYVDSMYANETTEADMSDIGIEVDAKFRTGQRTSATKIVNSDKTENTKAIIDLYDTKAVDDIEEGLQDQINNLLQPGSFAAADTENIISNLPGINEVPMEEIAGSISNVWTGTRFVTPAVYNGFRVVPTFIGTIINVVGITAGKLYIKNMTTNEIISTVNDFDAPIAPSPYEFIVTSLDQRGIEVLPEGTITTKTHKITTLQNKKVVVIEDYIEPLWRVGDEIAAIIETATGDIQVQPVALSLIVTGSAIPGVGVSTENIKHTNLSLIETTSKAQHDEAETKIDNLEKLIVRRYEFSRPLEFKNDKATIVFPTGKTVNHISQIKYNFIKDSSFDNMVASPQIDIEMLRTRQRQTLITNGANLSSNPNGTSQWGKSDFRVEAIGSTIVTEITFTQSTEFELCSLREVTIWYSEEPINYSTEEVTTEEV